MEHFKALNDLFFAANGDLYFTDQGTTGLQDPSGRLFRVTADGRITCVLSNVPSPNGVVMDLEMRCVLLAVTRANAVWRVPFDRNGNATKVGVFVQLSGGAGPDGLALDSEGGLAIAHVGFGSMTVTVNLPIGCARQDCHSLRTLRTEGPLYITESGTGSILTANVPV
ncbi:hypothetical protein BJN34_0270 [Cupriavidus necator]|uniref:SMP-30/Gluconolactonase/LRE-like region domain-containing protein n=1 Tax=Cupriavidus necator TaxID=106590 RepID=A0A2P1DV18_CUPNE|nr:hypothetical protein BJN34_0270 [Cupriavidus necator]